MKHQSRVLVGTRASEVHGFISSALSLYGLSVQRSRSGAELLCLCREAGSCVIIIDTRNFDADPFDLAYQIRCGGRSKDSPLVFYGPYNERAFELPLAENGGIDFIDPCADLSLFAARIKNLADLYHANNRIHELRSLLRAAEKNSMGKEVVELQLRSLQNERSGQQKYRDLVESLERSIIWSCDTHSLNINFVSKSAQQLMGYPLRQWSEETYFLLNHVHPSDCEKFLRALDSVDIRKDISLEHRFISQTGDTLWFHTCLKLLVRPDRTGAEIRGISSDITAMKCYEQEVVDARRRLTAVVDSAPIILFACDKEGVFRLVEGQGLKLIGRASADLVGKSVFEVFKKFPKLTAALYDGLRGVPSGFEMEFKSVCFDIRLTPKIDDNGELSGVLGVAHDVTERKKIENERRHLAEITTRLAGSLEFNATLDTLTGILVPEYADWCCVHFGERGDPLELVRVRHADKCKEPDIRKFLGADSSVREELGLKRVITSGSEEIHDGAPSGGLGLRASMTLPLKARGRLFGALVLASESREYSHADLQFAGDLAARASLALDNALLFRESEQAIHTRDEFLSIASHELRTPLTPLKLQFQSLERMLNDGKIQSPQPEKLAGMLMRSDKQINRITTLIDNLLNVSRINLGRVVLERAPMDLSKLILEVAEEFKDELVTAGSKLEFDLAKELEGNWDSFKLEQVVVNLLTNAVKYGRGQPIAIRTTRFENHARLEVEDHGIGISGNDHQRIFGLFERAAPANHYGGLGLGLYIAKSIVEVHGGSIRVDSQFGLGSTFVVDLPLNEKFRPPIKRKCTKPFDVNHRLLH